MMQQLSKSSKANYIKSILPKNWQEQVTDAYFSSDDLINAYVKGKSDGQNQYTQIIMDRFSENLKSAANLAEKFILLAKERGIDILNAHIKVDDVAKFQILLVVKEDDYLSDNFKTIYTLSNSLKVSNNTDQFFISFTFTHQSDNLSNECLSSDGYIIRYGNTGKA